MSMTDAEQDRLYLSIARDYSEFSHDEVQEFINQFKSFDSDGSGAINDRELGAIMVAIGEEVPKNKLKEFVKEVDTDGSGEVEFNEFMEIMRNMRNGKDSIFGSVVAKHAKINKVAGSDDNTSHSFAEEEKEAFVEYINDALGSDEDLAGRFPIDPESMDIFDACKDGILLCKLINDAVPDTIDERVINTKKLNAFNITENNNLVINSAKAIGCQMVNIGAEDLAEGKIHLLLGVLWQIVKIGLLSKISINNIPELYRLLEDGEELSDLLKLSPEQILLRWFNYHLKAAGSTRRVKNFGSDVKDSECYTILLQQICPNGECGNAPMGFSDNLDRAEAMLQEADKIGCRKYIKAKDVAKGNPKLNLAFTANLFNTYPALEELTEEEAAALEDWLFNSEGTREARAFCLWINSLGVEPFVFNLFEDLRDGLVLLRVMNEIVPGIVDWRRVNVPKGDRALNKFKKVENCNYAVLLGKELKFSLVGVQGSDLVDGNQTLTLALVWQMMRLHVITILSKIKGGSPVSEKEMVQWANDRVSGAGKNSHMESFRDPSLSDSRFFLDLLYAMRNSAVDYQLVTDDDELLNAKYAISVARKLGATIFLLPEDIVEVKNKMILTFVGSLMAVDVGGASTSVGSSSSSN
eukprot:TRINITY_DN2772_c0_g2_i1.p2 TRINITY_DN2772_c0_g2~~TRINITY_DN2772_c0_g2_i1.p2  ORF type:complete len:638 (-),score=261.76 TRINITY_DN2772_c0_g2_i1:38-1951(-)